MEHRYSENLHPPGAELVQKTLLQKLSALTRFHAGYFRISLSLCAQALLWKTLSAADPRALHFILHLLPAAAFDVLWSFALSSLVVLCALYAIRCACRFDCFKAELGHHVGVNYLFAPWASALLLLQCAPSPFLRPERPAWAFAVPILVLDVKVYGQWFTKGRKYCLSAVANPTSQMTVIANMAAAAAAAAATTDLKEIATCMFTVGLAHYLVLFVTLYQRLAGSESLLPALLRPVFFLFFAAPATASVAWAAISGGGGFDTAAKMLFFLSFFLFLCLVSRPMLFWRSMRTFSLAWWAYSFPLTVLALAAEKYAQEVKGGVQTQ
ncbi:S-type anion channel SLAH1 [Ananas comosus]|uniref:S-type anion channel SLAH1 n=1 Tax=Ananas comosus TaxID=4615 RepID=A0A199VJL3_ANACO|nr:S-type anion channel SLAH1 [Ananas comosus]